MHGRFIQGLIALVSLLALSGPAWAQDATTPERSKAVERIYKDYRGDGLIDACAHSKKALQKTLDELAPEADVDTPDLRPTLEAGIEQHTSGDCRRQAEATPDPTTTPTPTATVAPTATTVPDTGLDSNAGTPAPGIGGNKGGKAGKGGKSPLGPDDVKPVAPEVTPIPPAATPAPPAAEPSGPPATPAQVYRNADDGLPLPILLLAGLLALLALLALLYALISRLGWGESRLAPGRRAWDEARFRAGGTWGDFADWIRVGR